jgi:protein-disulfide isomerase
MVINDRPDIAVEFTMRRNTLLSAVAVAALALSSPSYAGEVPGGGSDPFAGRADQVPSALRILKANGVKATYLGDEGGLKGYLLQSANSQMQVVYLTPDGNGMVVGPQQRVGADGKLQNVTMIQFAAMRARYQATLRDVEERKRAADDARAKADQAAAELTATQRTVGAAEQQLVTPQTGTAPSATPLPASAAAPRAGLALPVTDTLAPPGQPDARFLAKSIQAGRFVHDAEATAYFRVGDPAKPTLYLVADPQCAHCHKAWARLKVLVDQRLINVKVVLVGALPGSAPMAADLLLSPDPGAAWMDGQGAEDGHIPAVLASPTSADAVAKLRKASSWLDTNLGFFQRQGGTGTPWMGYVANGKVYAMQGDLDTDLDAFTAGL